MYRRFRDRRLRLGWYREWQEGEAFSRLIMDLTVNNNYEAILLQIKLLDRQLSRSLCRSLVPDY